MKKRKRSSRKEKPISYKIGNLIILTVILSMFLTFWPVLELYLSPTKLIPAESLKENSITIPAINAQALIVQNIDPWDEKVYQKALSKGVAHAKDTSLPWEEGKSFLFAHSSGNPWELTSYNTPFLRLGDLMVGDEILITHEGKVYKYVVDEKISVWPSEVDYLEQSSENQLVLMTCTPIGTSLKRLLIFAKPS